MSKFCRNCGKEMADTDVFCGNCGTNSNVNDHGSAQVNVTINNQTNYGNTMIPNRNVAMCIIYSIITCGIYGIYWFIMMTDEANRANDEVGTSGVLAFVFTLLTCGLYGLYWNYKMGQRLSQAGQKRGINIPDNGLVYLLLCVFGLSIVSYVLIQNDLNKFSS